MLPKPTLTRAHALVPTKVRVLYLITLPPASPQLMTTSQRHCCASSACRRQ
jgi:hypothetical protein